MKLPRVIGSRLLALPVPLLIVTLVVFVMLRLTGDPTEIYLPPDAGEAQRAELREMLGLDRPLAIQYLTFLGNLAQGDFGRSLRFDRPALAVVFEAFPATLELAFAALAITLSVAILLGLLAAYHADRFLDRIIVNVAVFFQSMPSFWIGLVLIMIFSVELRWLPTSGRGGLDHLILPAVTVSLFFLPQVLLLMRATAVEAQTEDYVRTAWAKGLSPGAVYFLHILPNALNPVVSFMGLQTGKLLGGAVVVETVFAWPGLGQLSIQAVFQRDMAIVQAAVVTLAVLITLSNLVADIINALLDPRIRIK